MRMPVAKSRAKAKALRFEDSALDASAARNAQNGDRSVRATVDW
ncbi:MAG: hypothetical protein OEM98_18095 [Gammaproteobacteria bacterium]|nr:hypothetical protein [Gammaproteobacteria bacterium]